jgi:hypothetical protein
VVDTASHEQDRAFLPGRAGLLEEAREDDDLEGALKVLEGGDRHRLLGFGDHRPEPGHDPADDQSLPVEGLVAEVAAVGGHELSDLLGDLAHRMLREVEPEQLLLPAQPLTDRLGRGGPFSSTAPSSAATSNNDVWPLSRSRWVA